MHAGVPTFTVLRNTWCIKCTCKRNESSISQYFFTATVPLVGLQCVIVVFPDHTHFSAGTLLRRNDVTSTLIRRCFKVVCPLDYF